MKFVLRILCFALALEMALGGVAWAQDVAASSSIERKNRAPVSDEILEVTLPRAVEATLDNGLRVLVLEDHRVPIVSMELSISGAGPIYEPAELMGLAGMTARMLREGTTSRSNQEILEEVARLGATLSSSSRFGSAQTSVRASGLSRNLEEWFDVVRDVLLHPTFPESEFERLRQQDKVALRQQRTSAGFWQVNDTTRQSLETTLPRRGRRQKNRWTRWPRRASPSGIGSGMRLRIPF